MARNDVISRRGFIDSTLAATAAGTLFGSIRLRAEDKGAGAAQVSVRKIKTGFIGGGERGAWIAGLFKQHGGYEPVAVADYFQPVANSLGGVLGVPAGKCFSGLSGYKKVIESGIEALVIEDVPYFYPEQAAAAVEAGLHVYIAKPVAVDVPGCMAIGEAGKKATAMKRVFLVDYQMPTDPVNIEVAKRIREGGLGKLAHIRTTGIGSGSADQPLTETIESRLQKLVWVNDTALGCGNIGNFDIHAIDAAIWVLGRRPVAAMGGSGMYRSAAHGDAHDVISVVYEYADGLVHNHYGQALNNMCDGGLTALFHGSAASAQLSYFGKSFVRGGPKHFAGGDVENLYPSGAVRNIATFHANISEGKTGNDTVSRAVDSCLACILGREAGARRTRLTMEELLRENRKLEVNLKGLKA
jgi:myo-inositol 2-dehydrogenase / D-chiro-inositol 1-dehydrogenase